MTALHNERILVLDFGGQYAHLIANRIVGLNVFSEIVTPSEAPCDTDLTDVKGLILSGGPSSVHSPDQPQYNPAWFELDMPILGLCYGHQLLAKHFGGVVSRGNHQEYVSLPLPYMNLQAFSVVLVQTKPCG